MELVDYLSSDEENTKGNSKLAKEKKPSKMTNIDKKSIEDSDGINIVFEKTAPPLVKKNEKKSTDNEIECICLDDSDSDREQQSSPSVPFMLNTLAPTPAPKKSDTKRIDYLNLDSSDTEDEQENIQNSVNNLLSSAAILNDIEYGPAKPFAEFNADLTVPSCSQDTEAGKKRPNSPSDEVVEVPEINDDASNAPLSDLHVSCDSSSSLDDLSNKRFKHNTPVIDVTGLESSLIKDEKDPRVSMYREDEKILEAIEKKGISRIPTQLKSTMTAHEKAVSSLDWCSVSHSHLLLSSSADCTVKIWDLYSSNHPVQNFKLDSAIRAAKWSMSGEEVIAGGFGKKAHVLDALSGKEYIAYNVHNYVSCITTHSFVEDVFLCGTENAILSFDLRVNSKLPVRTFLSKCGEVLDIAFLNKNEFACSTSVVSQDSADRTIMVWDFASGAILSTQIFLERYTCPSLKVNQHDSTFVAQTNGDYIAAFSTQRPYKIQNKRYTGHKVSGYAVECDISTDGKYLASGDANGDLYFYGYASVEVINKLTIKPDVPAHRLKWHPVLPSTIAVATWDGEIQIWK